MLTVIAVWCLPVAFTACSKNSLWCNASYWLTQSAGKYGTLIIVLVAGFLYTLHLSSRTEKIKAFARPVFVLLAVLSAFAFINEHFIKKILKYPRPSHTYVINHAGKPATLDSLYKLETDQRQVFLKELIFTSPVLTGTVDGKVLDHWVDEAGYSFPSGHSFNAFLLATLLAFSIYNSRYKKLFFLPLLWAACVAISRVAMGAHSALDVTVGASLGIAIAALFLYFDTTRQLVIRKKT